MSDLNHFVENRIFAPNCDFGDFWLLPLWPIIWPEMSQNVIHGRKWPLETLKTITNTLDDDFWWLEQILKNHKKSSFLLIFSLWVPTKRKWAKMMIFYDFLKFVLIIKNHHPRYWWLFLRSQEAISGRESHFGTSPAR